jgi:hypothetical protein
LGVVVAGAELVVAVLVVVVDSVPVVPVVVVVVAAEPVSSTTAGADSVWVVVSVVVLVVSFFWQPVVSAIAATAAKPRIRTFFISLISFFLEKRVSPRSAIETPQGNRRGIISEGGPLSTENGRRRPARKRAILGVRPTPGGPAARAVRI